MSTSAQSSLEHCSWSVGRGSLLGAALGSGFHFVGGNVVKSQGRATLTSKHISQEAAKAGARLAAVFALYTTVRCALLQATGGSDAISCGTAGALAVLVPIVADKNRLQFLREYYGDALSNLAAKQASTSLNKGPRVRTPPAPTGLIVAVSALSGACIFGLPDMLAHRLLGVRW